ncbi:MAG: dihydrodipicolinate synthase family protein, partial [Alteromonas sp.]|nr:dihydrodipicolinate synthase family protein [Alteromonas sp.]
MFTGLSAFPITPFKQEAIDYKAFKGLVDNLASANVDSICAIGST